MIEATGSALQMFFSPGVLIAFFLVIPYALLGGVLPLTNLPLTIILLGMVGLIDPIIALVLVIAKDAQGDITEPVPSILMGIPGARAAQATILDGYPLAKQGRAGFALGASYTSTLVGGIFGAIILYVAIIPAREILNYFASPEFFLFTLLAVLSVGILSTGALVKGILSACLGLVIAFIGYSEVAGEVRVTFGISYLFDGLSIIPMIVGLFAIPEAIGLIVSNRSVAREHAEEVLKGKAGQRQALEGMRTALKYKSLLFRSSMIGVIFGMMPGVGATAAHWASYTAARMTEKGAMETFGHGDIRGVIAADTPNNSIDGAEMIPLLVFGIPGSAGGAIRLTLLILLGFTPGLPMLTTHLDVTILIVLVIVMSNIVVVPIMFVFAGTIAKFTALPPNVIAPFIVIFTLLSAFMATQSLADLVVVLGISVLGLFMKAYGWPRPPILVAIVLSQLLEKYFWLTLGAYGHEVFFRPQFVIILAFSALVIGWAIRFQARSNRAAALATAGARPDAASQARRKSS